jgi:IS30 family transposase
MARRLTLEARDRIAQLRRQGAEQKEIAKTLGCSAATICRELHRNGAHGQYHAAQAQQPAQGRRRERPRSLVDRRSRFTIIVKIQSEQADHVHARLKQRLKELKETRRHSITLDNGTEFAHCHRLEKHLGMQSYLADRGCSYPHGTNENTNGLIRQYSPKRDGRSRDLLSGGAVGGKSTKRSPPRLPRLSDSR